MEYNFHRLNWWPAVERFLYRVERLSKANKITSERLINDLNLLLKKVPLSGIMVISRTWETLKQGLLDRFKGRRTDAEIRQAISFIKQKPDETFLDFLPRVIDATTSLNTPLIDSDLCFILRRNMLYNIKSREGISRAYRNWTSMYRDRGYMEEITC